MQKLDIINNAEINNTPKKEVIDRADLFKEELDVLMNLMLKSRLNTDTFALFTMLMLDSLPSYFFHVPASSTGKYHPQCSLGEGGLVRHTKLGMKVATENFVLTTMFNLSNEAKVMAYIALMFHDGFKHGFNHAPYTDAKHPLFIKQVMNDIINKMENLEVFINDTDITDMKALRGIAEAVSTHMGQWTFDYRSKKKILEEPRTPLELFIHLCDYTASRKVFDYYGEMMKGIK